MPLVDFVVGSLREEEGLIFRRDVVPAHEHGRLSQIDPRVDIRIPGPGVIEYEYIAQCVVSPVWENFSRVALLSRSPNPVHDSNVHQ